MCLSPHGQPLRLPVPSVDGPDKIEKEVTEGFGRDLWKLAGAVIAQHWWTSHPWHPADEKLTGVEDRLKHIAWPLHFGEPFSESI